MHLSSLRPFAGDAATRHPQAQLERVQRQFERAQRLLEQISDPLRRLADPTKWREQAATLQVLHGEVELLARSLSQGMADLEPQDQLANLRRLLSELDALPVQNPDDGFSSRDHDDELYREPR